MKAYDKAKIADVPLDAARPAMTATSRHVYLDRAKGLAIFLVVLGHVVAREGPPGSEWYLWLKNRIYVFHMPLFMCVSGMVYGLKWQAPAHVRDYLADLSRRVARLLPAYLLFGALIFVGKLAVQQFAVVDNPVQGWHSFLGLLIAPSKSFTSFLWYIYALTLIFAAFPVLHVLLRGQVLAMLVICVAFWWLPSSPVLAWDKLREFSAYFVLGVLLARHHDTFLRLLRLAWPVMLLAFVWYLPEARAPFEVRACAALSIFSVLGLMQALPDMRVDPLAYLGRYTLSIYLLNTIVIGVVKLMLLETIGWSHDRFPQAFAILLATGVVGPVLVKQILFRRVPWLDRITT